MVQNGSLVRSLKKVFSATDLDGDGCLSLQEFLRAVELSGGAIEPEEAEHLFLFWDTCAGTTEQRGVIDYHLAVQDLVSNQPTYGTVLPGGGDGFRKVGSNGNKPSQVGGIFAGGMDSAEAERNAIQERESKLRSNERAAQPLQPLNHPQKRSNESSIEGGIFGEQCVSDAVQDVNKPDRNKSSISGGIFGHDSSTHPMPGRTTSSKNVNQSSIPGGIFG